MSDGSNAEVPNEMPQQREDFLQEAATTLLSEQLDHILQHFHDYILFIEDSFFTAEQQKRGFFDIVCTSLLQSVMSTAFISFQVREIEEKLEEVIMAYGGEYQKELAVFQDECERIKQNMFLVASGLENRWKIAESHRQDEFRELCVSCQRDVANITTELRLGILKYFQDKQMSAVLEGALHTKTEEIRQIQHQLEEVSERRLAEFAEYQKALQEEREKYRRRFIAVEEKTTKIIEELTADGEERHRKYLCEIQEVQRHHVAKLGALECQICKEREANAITHQSLAEELERCRATVKKLEEEKKRMTEEGAELQTQLDEYRRRYAERDSQAKREFIEYQALTEAMRLEEAQEFRKQLVEAVRRGASSSTHMTSAFSHVSKGSGDAFAVDKSVNTHKHVFTSKASAGMARRRDELRSVSPNSSRFTEHSMNPYRNWVPHSPTSSYIKLMNLSEQLRRHVEQN